MLEVPIMDDDGDDFPLPLNSGRESASAASASVPSLAGLKFSSEFIQSDVRALKTQPDALAVTGATGDRTTGFSYMSLPDKGVFASKKGQPVRTTKSAKFNGSIRTMDRSNAKLTDAELINVLRFDTKKADVNPQDTAKLYPAEFAKVPTLFNELDREINPKLKMVTTPALGYVYAVGEANNAKASGNENLKRIHRYRNGIAPLKKLSLIEDELDRVVRKKGHTLSNIYTSSHVTQPADELPQLTKSEFMSVRKQIYVKNRMSSVGRNQDLSVDVSYDPAGDCGLDTGGSSSYKPNASITVTVPHSDMSATDFQNDIKQDILLSERRNDAENEEEEEEFSLAAFATPRTPTEEEILEKKRKDKEAKEKKRSEEFAVKERKGLRTVKRDPSRLAKQLPRSNTGEYLVNDYSLGKSNYMFALSKELGSTNGLNEEYHPSFQHTKDKIRSKKDKVFLKGPEEGAIIDAIGFTQLDGEDELSPSTNISVGGDSGYGPPDSVKSMPSRYLTGKEHLTERQLTGKPHEIPGFIKTMVMKKEEISCRLACYVCHNDAFFWCVECSRNYCKLCWNSIGHHEYIDPDEVWNNRKPENVIEYNPNDEVGMNVFLRPNEICQGRVRGVHTPVTGARPKSPGLQSFNFPPPGGVPADSTAGGSRGSNLQHRGKHRGKLLERGILRGNAPRQSGDDMHGLVVSPPKHRPPPGMSPLNSPANKVSHPPSPAKSTGQQTPNDSLSVHSPDNSTQQPFSPVHKTVTHDTQNRTQHEIVIMDPIPNQKLMWQVNSSGHSLCPVSSLVPGKYTRPARGITSEYFPQDWKQGRANVHRQFDIYNGVTVATRKIPEKEPTPKSLDLKVGSSVTLDKKSKLSSRKSTDSIDSVPMLDAL